MIEVLVDINVVLDVLLDRAAHVEASALLLAHIESGRMRGFLAAHAVTTIYYFLARELGESRAKKAIASLTSVLDIAPIDANVIAEALLSPSRDFEDAVTAAAAHRAACGFIVTRDPKGFSGSLVKAIAPSAAAALVKS